MSDLEIYIRAIIDSNMPVEDRMKSYSIEHLQERRDLGFWRIKGEIRVQGELHNREFQIDITLGKGN